MNETVTTGPSNLVTSDVPLLSEYPLTDSSSSLQQIHETFQTRAHRHLDYIARHFNILDRLFSKANNSSEIHRLQVGANIDGVFSNLTAKPDNNQEGIDGDKPPTYNEAAADAVPPYYGIDENGIGIIYNEICIDGLPVGNIINFLWNLIISFSFQFVGFLLTYILHTSHAARQGSKFGLGITFLSYGYSMIPNDVTSKIGKDNHLNRLELDDPNTFDDTHAFSNSAYQDDFHSDLSHGTIEERGSISILSIFISILGTFILLKSVYDYIRVKRLEKIYLDNQEVRDV